MIKEPKHRSILRILGDKSSKNAGFLRYYSIFTYKIKELTLKSLLPFLISTITPENAYAFQVHGRNEGLYVHQIAHILYAFSVAALAYKLKKTRLTEKRAWRLTAIGMLILTIWNIWAFSGHIVAYLIPQKDIGPIPGTDTPGICLNSWLDVAYYILKFDHLLSVPAMFLIYLGLADLYKMSFSKPQEEEGGR